MITKFKVNIDKLLKGHLEFYLYFPRLNLVAFWLVLWSPLATAAGYIATDPVAGVLCAYWACIVYSIRLFSIHRITKVKAF